MQMHIGAHIFTLDTWNELQSELANVYIGGRVGGALISLAKCAHVSLAIQTEILALKSVAHQIISCLWMQMYFSALCFMPLWLLYRFFSIKPFTVSPHCTVTHSLPRSNRLFYYETLLINKSSFSESVLSYYCWEMWKIWCSQFHV